MNELALFAGSGGGILGGHILGWETVCAVERDAYCAAVLAQRQNDRILKPFPIWSDVTTFDAKPWRGIVDVVSGGFPCQDISSAGRGAGLSGKRSGLWHHMARIIGDVRPDFAWMENSPQLVGRGLGTVLGNLAEMGLDAEWGVVSAADTGAPHLRERIWILAYTTKGRRIAQEFVRHQQSEERTATGSPLRCVGVGHANGVFGHQGRTRDTPKRQGRRNLGRGGVSSYVAHTNSMHVEGFLTSGAGEEDRQESSQRQIRSCRTSVGVGLANTDGGQQPCRRLSGGMGRQDSTREDADTGIRGRTVCPAEPDVGRMANGVPSRVDRLSTLGNAQVPRVAAAAWEFLLHRIGTTT